MSDRRLVKTPKGRMANHRAIGQTPTTEDFMRIAFIATLALIIGVIGYAFWPTSADRPTPLPSVGPERGATVFRSYCATCHQITAPDGTKFAGGNAMAGPNLYGVIGRSGGAVEGYRYSSALSAAGADHGLIWTPDTVAAYVQDPTGYLRQITADDRARSKMAFRLRTSTAADDARSVAAYLEQFAAR